MLQREPSHDKRASLTPREVDALLREARAERDAALGRAIGAVIRSVAVHTGVRPMLGRRSLLFLLVALLFAALAVPAAQAGDGPDTFIRQVGQEAIDSLTGRQLSDRQREERFRSIMKRTFAMNLIARFTLGRYWRIATEAQQKEYTGLFEDFIVQAYAARFKDYDGEVFKVGTVRDINDREKLVHSTLTLKDGRVIPVQWRVHSNDGYRVVDIIVEGVSMAITHRDEFAAVINQNGGKVDGLLAALRRKTGK